VELETQISPLRCASVEMTSGGVGGCAGKTQVALTVNAGPSTALRFAQDDSFMDGRFAALRSRGQILEDWQAVRLWIDKGLPGDGMGVLNADGWIRELRLAEHPEGGFYWVTYTAEMTLAAAALPEGFAGARPASTAIYFLLSNERAGRGGFSAFHRLRSDEMWHFYAGSPLVVHVIARDGGYTKLLLGPEAEAGQEFQAVVKAGCWFASAPLLADSFALVGCTVAPGFDFADFELARRDELSQVFPQHDALIAEFTRV
jgi:predicted cupin superfamily sugar epimerase